MSIYINNQEILEIHLGTVTIDSVYYGSTLVYTSNPYKPQTIIVNSSGAYTFNQILPKGVYDLILCAGGGNTAGWAYGGYPWGANGGSGACFEGEIYNPKKQNVTIYAGAAQQDSYIDFNSERMMTLGKGTNAAFNSAGVGGQYSKSNNLITGNIRKAQNGNNGAVGLGSGTGGNSVCSVNNWGQGKNIAGGIILTYLRNKI